MKSLKTVIPELAAILGVPADSLYERQRALVRAGLLDQRPGRGPGTGVSATPRAVAWILLSVLASDSRSEGIERAAELARAKVRTHKKCPLTGKKCLLDVLEFTLGSAEKVQKLFQVVVSRDTLIATLEWFDQKEEFRVVFGIPEEKSKDGLRVHASLDIVSLVEIERVIRGDASAGVEKRAIRMGAAGAKK